MKVIFPLLVNTVTLLAGSVLLLEDTLHLSVGEYRSIAFRVLEAQSGQTTMEGSATVQPDTSRVEYILLTADAFRRWGSGSEVDTLGFHSAGSGDIRIAVPGFGDYVLIVSNRGNEHPVSVFLRADLHFEGEGVQYDALPMAFRMIIIILSIGVLIAAGILGIRRMRG